jgi:hypothetical protein
MLEVYLLSQDSSSDSWAHLEIFSVSRTNYPYGKDKNNQSMPEFDHYLSFEVITR